MTKKELNSRLDENAVDVITYLSSVFSSSLEFSRTSRDSRRAVAFACSAHRASTQIYEFMVDNGFVGASFFPAYRRKRERL